MYAKPSEAAKAVLKEAAAWELLIPTHHLSYDAMWVFTTHHVYLLLALLSHEGPGKALLQKFGFDSEWLRSESRRFFDTPTKKLAHFIDGLPKARKQVTAEGFSHSDYTAEAEAARMGSSTFEPFHMVLGIVKERTEIFPAEFYKILVRVLTPSGEINLEAVETTLQKAKAGQKRLIAEDKPFAAEERRLQRALGETESALEAIRKKRGAFYRRRSRKTFIELLQRGKAELASVA